MVKYKKPSLVTIFAVFICLSVAAMGFVSASTPIPSPNYSNLTVANHNGTVKYPAYSSTAYNYFNGTGGLNTPHFTTSTNNVAGSVTNVTTGSNGYSSGTFYISDNGGRGWEDDGILMIAVNGTLSSNFNVEIASQGYQWTPVSKNSIPAYNATTYASGIDQTFTKTDFDNGYVSTWKPSTGANYPIFEGQNMSNTTSFQIIFVDLYAGIIGTNTLNSAGWSGQQGIVNNGMLQVDYTVNGLPTGSLMAFDIYAFCNNSNAGQGIRWTNCVNTAGNKSATSGYNVRNFQ